MGSYYMAELLLLLPPLLLLQIMLGLQINVPLCNMYQTCPDRFQSLFWQWAPVAPGTMH
jgi:hypothetical protein